MSYPLPGGQRLHGSRDDALVPSAASYAQAYYNDRYVESPIEEPRQCDPLVTSSGMSPTCSDGRAAQRRVAFKVARLYHRAVSMASRSPAHRTWTRICLHPTCKSGALPLMQSAFINLLPVPTLTRSLTVRSWKRLATRLTRYLCLRISILIR